jgi:hypothetical protein
MTDDERRIGAERAMRRVLDECLRRGFLPLVLIAGDGEQVAVLPCGKAPEAKVWELIQSVAEGRARRVVARMGDPLPAEGKGDA